MEIIRVPRTMQDIARNNLQRSHTVGLVPTMGALHDGHMLLLKTCTQENDYTVVSIYVNPMQFAPGEDIVNYPRDLDSDLEKLEMAGVDTAFLPGNMYAGDFTTWVDVQGLSDKLCGRFRPGHFRGVTTVVLKLLNIVSPTHAYFGRKDYQQSVIIHRMVEDLNMSTEIITLPTVREPDGLAMSSRNQNLSAQQRVAALAIYDALTKGEQMIKKGKTSAKDIEKVMHMTLKAQKLITKIQYATVCHPDTLEDVHKISGEVVLAIAVKMDNVRLIDNVQVRPEQC